MPIASTPRYQNHVCGAPLPGIPIRLCLRLRVNSAISLLPPFVRALVRRPYFTCQRLQTLVEIFGGIAVTLRPKEYTANHTSVISSRSATLAPTVLFFSSSPRALIPRILSITSSLFSLITHATHPCHALMFSSYLRDPPHHFVDEDFSEKWTNN